MIEISQNRRTRDAYRRAHEERGEFIKSLWKRIVPSAR